MLGAFVAGLRVDFGKFRCNLLAALGDALSQFRQSQNCEL